MDKPDNPGAHSLLGLLKGICAKHAAPEGLGCDFCGDRPKPKCGQLEFTVDDMPQVMILRLRRFNQRGKRMDKVFGESHLSFGNTSFALVGILQHLGNGVHSGHYISIVRVGERWQIRNDSICEDFTQLPGAE